MQPSETIPGQCPYCSEPISFVIDCSISEQEYVEDCSVCCQPILCQVQVLDDESIKLSLSRENA